MMAPRQPQQQQRPRRPPATQSLATLKLAIDSRRGAFADIATEYLPPEKLVKLAHIALAKVPGLVDCTQLSILDSLMMCARLGLQPHVPGGIWLVPFKQQQEGQKVCTPIIDYRGLIDVARRSGVIAAVHAGIRCEHDQWEYWIDTESKVLVHLRHIPGEGDEGGEYRGDMIGAYFVAKLTNGQCHAVYLTLQQIEGYRARSRSSQSEYSPWNTDYPAMCMKTACRRGVNLLPTTPEIQALRESLDEEERGASVLNETARQRVRAVQARQEAEQAMRGEEPPPSAEGTPAEEPPADDGADVPGFNESEGEGQTST